MTDQRVKTVPSIAEFMSVVKAGHIRSGDLETVFRDRGYSSDMLPTHLVDLVHYAETRQWIWVGSAGDFNVSAEWLGAQSTLEALGITLDQWASMDINKSV